MTEIATRKDESAPQLDLIWQRRLDELIRGECSEEDFMDELSNCRLLSADSAWSVVALLDQRYRRGQMPVELFRSIESKIAQRELGALDYGTTIELGGVDIDIDIDLNAPDPASQLAARAAATATAAATAAAATTSATAATTTSAAAATTAGAAAAAAERPAPAPRAKPSSVKVRKEADPSPTADVGRVLRDRYVLESRLGSGGMGAVFKALDRFRCDLPQADRRVAIKILHEKAVGRPEILVNLRREFYCAQVLSHPNIIKVYELDRDGDVEFFSMELLEGDLLSSVLEHLDPLSMSRSRAWAIILEVAAGLAHAHARNVVHADLKPQNIMLTKRGDIRILDFGASSAIVRQPWSAETAQRSAVTPAYASC
ncbi:MAG TPA: serine/threonine-protein kinase, partial [Steroidobacteraceae bacterium]|nr:serine/threonine-protein kinase [Steroidobacteraceae bacterium]